MNLAQLLSRFGNLFRWWVTIAPWEQAVRVRLGRHVCVLSAGAHLRIPGIDRLFIQSTRRRFSSIPTQILTTQDGKALTVSGALAYAIGDIETLYTTLHAAEDTLQTEAQAAIARFVRCRTLEGCDPAEIEEHVTNELDLGRYGIIDVEVAITDFAAVRTYRLLMGEPKNFMHDGEHLSTLREHGAPR